MNKTTIFCLVFLFVSLIDAKSIEKSEKHWLNSCISDSCQRLINQCRNCTSENDCKTCISDSNPECFSCSEDIYNESDHIIINTLNYMPCDSRDPFQIKICNIYCRGKRYQNGECLSLNYKSVCLCGFSSTQTFSTTTRPSTTTWTVTATTSTTTTSRPITSTWTTMTTPRPTTTTRTETFTTSTRFPTSTTTTTTTRPTTITSTMSTTKSTEYWWFSTTKVASTSSTWTTNGTNLTSCSFMSILNSFLEKLSFKINISFN